MQVVTENLPNAGNREIYEEMYQIYCDMVPALTGQFDRLAQIS